jgi:hypothetical protein
LEDKRVLAASLFMDSLFIAFNHRSFYFSKMLQLLILSLLAQTAFSCARPMCYNTDPSAGVDNVFLADILETTYINSTDKVSVKFRPVCSYKSTVDVLGKNFTTDDLCLGEAEVGNSQLVFVKSLNVTDYTAEIEVRCAGDGIRNATKEEVEKVFESLKDKKIQGECINIQSSGNHLGWSWMMVFFWLTLVINIY